MKLVLELPTKETPGFLRRSRSALIFRDKLTAEKVDPAVFDEMIEFLLPLVKEPKDRGKAKEALWDASQAQFEEILASLTGGGATVPPVSAETSPSSTSQV